MPLANEVVISAAGSGKTRRLVRDALCDRSKRVLITTYTKENRREVESRLWEEAGTIPHFVTVMSWFEFLLRECVKPYQSFRTDILTIRSIDFVGQRSRFAKKANFGHYFVDAGNNLYSDSVSDLACELDNISGGKVVSRLRDRFDAILIDELQDLAGYDLDFLELLLKSGIRILGVADPRQVVYVTNNSARNRKYRYGAIVTWVEVQRVAGLLSVSELVDSYRCNQSICDFGDSFYPHLSKTTGRNTEIVSDMGVHLVHVDDLVAYRTLHKPQELRWGRGKGDAWASDPMNFGEVKGMSFPRVLIHPTKPMMTHLESGVELQPESRAKFYVAVTRARHSVGIVTQFRKTNSGLGFWSPAFP